MEAEIIVAAVLDLDENGIPLSLYGVQSAIGLFVRLLPNKRKEKAPFQNGKTGKHLLKLFIHRHPEISLRRRATLKPSREDSMSLYNIVMNFARLSEVCRE